jgi:hypothetical protein
VKGVYVSHLTSVSSKKCIISTLCLFIVCVVYHLCSCSESVALWITMFWKGWFDNLCAACGQL